MHPNVKALLEIEFAAQKSEEWLALRGNMLTASDAATALGVNKYETPADSLLFRNVGEEFPSRVFIHKTRGKVRR